jgi:hypothetical protein
MFTIVLKKKSFLRHQVHWASKDKPWEILHIERQDISIACAVSKIMCKMLFSLR